VTNAITGLGSHVAFEDNNKYALLLDVDGNGWSDRLVRMAHFNTPILKQARGAGDWT
jgi:hypothetical protein